MTLEKALLRGEDFEVNFGCGGLVIPTTPRSFKLSGPLLKSAVLELSYFQGSFQIGVTKRFSINLAALAKGANKAVEATTDPP